MFVQNSFHFSGGLEKTGSLEIIPENCPLDPAGRLSISLDDQNLSSGPSSCGSPPGLGGGPLGTPGASQTLPGRLTASAQAAQVGRRGGQHQQPEMMSYTCLPQVSTCESGGKMTLISLW